MRSLVFATLAAFASVFTAQAATLVTPLMIFAPGERVHCDVVNVGSSTITVKIEIIGENGDVLRSQSGSRGPGTGAGSRQTCTTGTGTPPGCLAYCRFTAPRKRQIRGVLTVSPSDSQSPVAAVAAQ